MTGAGTGAGAVLRAALTAHDAGLSVLPARQDGSKVPRALPVPSDCTHPRCEAARVRARAERRPAFGWKHYTHARLTRDDVARLFRSRTGLCVVCGAVSGEDGDASGSALVMLETDAAGMADVLRDAARNARWGEAMYRLDAGYLEQTPKGGVHWLTRIPLDCLAGNTKLARRSKQPHEMADPGDRVQVLIETRGEGGQAVVAPSHGSVHPSGRPYVLLAGGFATIPMLNAAEWAGITAAARRLDSMPTVQLRGAERGAERPAPSTSDASSVMEAFNHEASWRDILEPHGWVLVDDSGENHLWRRPGKHEGISATAGDAGTGPLYVFTSSTDFDSEQAYSKFAAYAVLNHRGDMSAAARAIRVWSGSRSA